MISKKNKTKNALLLTLKISWWCVLLLLAFLLVNILTSKLSGKVPSVFGYSVVNIVSSSMEDEIPKGSYILIKKADPQQVELGDVICFYSTDPKIYGIPNTHRVVEEPIVTDGGIEFVTRGDASPVNDKETAKGERLIGIYVKKLDGLTAFTRIIEGKTLIIVIISLQICMFLMFAYTAVDSKAKAKAQKKENETKDEDRT